MIKNCKFCETPLSEEMKFCPSCGKSVTEEGKLPNSNDFFKEFINYDPNIWRTIKLLLLKPGKLTEQFIYGDRESITSPAKIFIILSAIAITLGSISLTNSMKNDPDKNVSLEVKDLKEKPQLKLQIETSSGVRIGNIQYYKAEIDSLGAKGFLSRRGFKQGTIINWIVERTIKKYQESNYKEISVNHERNASVLLYFLIPFFAFFIKTFRWKRSFTEHLTFTLYFFSAFYALQIVLTTTSYLVSLIHPIPFHLLLIPGTVLYLIVALKAAYKFQWIGAFFIGILSSLFLFVTMALLLFFSSLLILAL